LISSSPTAFTNSVITAASDGVILQRMTHQLQCKLNLCV
jgi:hypothetical protein